MSQDEKKARVLLVDDDEFLTDFLRDYFREISVNMDSATSPEKARELTSENLYSLVLVDVRLKSHDGSNLAAEMIKKSAQPNVILFTGNDKRWVKEHVKVDIPVLHKPFSVEELDNLVRSCGIETEQAKPDDTPDMPDNKKK